MALRGCRPICRESGGKWKRVSGVSGEMASVIASEITYYDEDGCMEGRRVCLKYITQRKLCQGFPLPHHYACNTLTTHTN